MTKNPDTSTIVEVNIANPVVSIVFDIAVSKLELFLRSCQNLNRKCSESSTAMPKQIEKVMAIGGLMGMPMNPKYPAAKIMGIKFGNMLIKPTRNDKNNKLIMMLIKINAKPKPLKRSKTR